jgi:hypothetical protein
MPNQTLSGTSLSALTTNILIEPTFGGSFDGAISQFRMYTEPLSYPEVIHNFDILKNPFLLFDYGCPDCSDDLINDITYDKEQSQITFFSSEFSGYSYDLYYTPEGGSSRTFVGSYNSFPNTINLTSSPIFPENGFGTYYFYFGNIDQNSSHNSGNRDSSYFASGINMELVTVCSPAIVIDSYSFALTFLLNMFEFYVNHRYYSCYENKISDIECFEHCLNSLWWINRVSPSTK